MMHRRLLALLVVGSVSCGLVACGGDDGGTGETITDSGSLHFDTRAGDSTQDSPGDSTTGFDVGGDSTSDSTTTDSGVSDSGTKDSGTDAHDATTDSSTIDSTTSDTSTIDSGIDSTAIDSATIDSASVDSATTDTAVVDSSVLDSIVGDTTDAGPTLPASIVWVTRVGDGTTTLSSASAPVFIDKYRLSDGSLLGSITLPTAASGANHALTIAGTGTSEGGLTRSTDGKYVTLAGYATAPATASVASSSTTTGAAILRVAARIDASETIDTTTTTTSNSGASVRSAVTTDGSAFWMAGGATGVYYVTYGGSGAATAISSGLTNARRAEIFGGALYGSSGSSTFRLFDFGGALPTTSTTPTDLPGTPSVSGDPSSPYGFSALALHGAAIDTLYVCDDRAIASGGGVQRWTFASSTWSLSTTFNDGLASGCRDLTTIVDGSIVYVVFTTAENPSRLAVYVDTTTGLSTTALVPVATSSTNEFFRGIALAPSP